MPSIHKQVGVGKFINYFTCGALALHIKLLRGLANPPPMRQQNNEETWWEILSRMASECGALKEDEKPISWII